MGVLGVLGGDDVLGVLGRHVEWFCENAVSLGLVCGRR